MFSTFACSGSEGNLLQAKALLIWPHFADKLFQVGIMKGGTQEGISRN